MTSNGFLLKNKGLVPVSHKNIIFPAFGKEQTAKGGVLYEDRMFRTIFEGKTKPCFAYARSMLRLRYDTPTLSHR